MYRFQRSEILQDFNDVSISKFQRFQEITNSIIQAHKNSNTIMQELKQSCIHYFKNSRIQDFNDSRCSRLYDFKFSWFQDSRVEDFNDSRLHRFQDFNTAIIQIFNISRIPKSQNFKISIFQYFKLSRSFKIWSWSIFCQKREPPPAPWTWLPLF